jgi:hypothetical protein
LQHDLKSYNEKPSTEIAILKSGKDKIREQKKLIQTTSEKTSE